MKFCTNCGFKMEDKDTFCQNCGQCFLEEKTKTSIVQTPQKLDSHNNGPLPMAGTALKSETDATSKPIPNTDSQQKEVSLTPWRSELNTARNILLAPIETPDYVNALQLLLKVKKMGMAQSEVAQLILIDQLYQTLDILRQCLIREQATKIEQEKDFPQQNSLSEVGNIQGQSMQSHATNNGNHSDGGTAGNYIKSAVVGAATSAIIHGVARDFGGANTVQAAEPPTDMSSLDDNTVLESIYDYGTSTNGSGADAAELKDTYSENTEKITDYDNRLDSNATSIGDDDSFNLSDDTDVDGGNGDLGDAITDFFDDIF